MDTKTVIIHYAGLISRLPPLLSLLAVIKDLGFKCVFLGLEHLKTNADICQKTGVEYRCVDYRERSISLLRHPIDRLCYETSKHKAFQNFRKSLWRVIDEYRANDSDVIVWSIDSCSAANLGNRALELGHRHVQSFYELEEEFGRGVSGFDLDQLYKNATLVECEPNRAEILAATHDIPNIPFVIQNCPYQHPRSKNLLIEDTTVRSLVSNWENRFVFLYQGVLTQDRAGIGHALSKLCESFPQDIVAIMTWQDKIDLSALAKYNNFCRIPYLAAPTHLQVTSHASVGLAFYARGGMTGYSKLNAVYCAPNKIYEYAGFGIPILGNDIPGLKYTVGAYGAGMCWNERAVGLDVISCAKKIKENYSQMSKASQKMYDDVDLPKCVKNILAYATSK